ncbi:MAG: hypothetical protein ACFFAO_15340 [Candidatus Hermodarchaeota archaeon]
MNQTSKSLDKIKNLSVSNCKILESLIETIRERIRGKRKIMYSDVINLIIREGYIGDLYSKLILWCNYKIRLGKTYIEFD